MSDTTNLPMTPHKREVLRAWLDGKTIQQKIDNTWTNWDLIITCDDDAYRIKPEPEPKSYRWYTRDEFMALFVTWPARFIVKTPEGMCSAWLSLRDTIFDVVTSRGHDVDYQTFNYASYSHDGGKTWQPFGVEVES